MSKCCHSKQKCYFLIGLFIVITAIIFSFPPISQDLEYHNFVDKTPFTMIDSFSFPNFGNVISNVPFLLFGIFGLIFLSKKWQEDSLFICKTEKIMWVVFFTGIFLVGIGSGYYHLYPNNDTLLWDRLPMTIGFMSLFAIIITERISKKAGIILFPIMLIIGVASVIYWINTEATGNGDLRPYVIVQFFPMLAIPLILAMFPAHFGGTKYIAYAFIWYMIAKITEFYDVGIFEILGNSVSGHTIKHLASAIGSYSIYEYLKQRFNQ